VYLKREEVLRATDRTRYVNGKSSRARMSPGFKKKERNQGPKVRRRYKLKLQNIFNIKVKSAIEIDDVMCIRNWPLSVAVAPPILTHEKWFAWRRRKSRTEILSMLSLQRISEAIPLDFALFNFRFIAVVRVSFFQGVEVL
jgi:hypothetical protein